MGAEGETVSLVSQSIPPLPRKQKNIGGVSRILSGPVFGTPGKPSLETGSPSFVAPVEDGVWGRNRLGFLPT